MSIESLKEQARRHEQREEWQKALEQYQKAIRQLDREEQPDIGLYNRVGDLYVRVGNLDRAVEHYEKALELYREAYLPNNAIAVCKKIIRNVPTRHEAFLKMGQIRAEQGFLSDARANFLTYAERMQQAGNLDESFRALIEFCDLAPEDVQLRLAVADQMTANERSEEAFVQLRVAYRQLIRMGDDDLSLTVGEQLRALDPSIDLDAVAVASSPASAVGSDGEILATFGEIELDRPLSGDEDTAVPEELAAAAESFAEWAAEDVAGTSGEPRDEDEAAAMEIHVVGHETDEEDEAAFGLAGTHVEPDDDEGVATELPMFAVEDEDDEVAAELPMFAMDDDEGEDAAPLPMLDDGGTVLAPEDFGEPPPKPHEAEEYTGSEEDMVEIDVGLAGFSLEADEALEGAAEEAASERAEAPTRARSVGPPPPPKPAPAKADAGDYVDLGSMIFGDDEEVEEKTTRFRVAYEEPSGNEEADFARMLSQFKEKVSENLDSGDVRAHYDLGTAYKEMGLLDEAIAEFQAALRASANHLPTYELMGQTFLEMGNSRAAVKSLERALQAGTGIEDDLIGIYYCLARAHEDLGNKESALEFYDRVFSLDINFADVTERLRALR